jgi:DNA-binding NarL/FixJ family response regulator
MSYQDLHPYQRAFLAEHLTELQHAVVKARIDGHTWQRIGLAMNLDEATVRGHHKRAVRRLANARKDAA